jgi:UDP-3-O-[3-hydroxymyristoyl] glucosamine N-acyltransferase
MKQNLSNTLGALADLIGARLQGDPDCVVYGIASLKNAKPGEISFLSNPQYRKELPLTAASAVIVSPDELAHCSVYALISDNPRLSLAKAAAVFEKKQPIIPGIDQTAIIGQACKIPASVFIGPHVVLGDRVILGEGVVIGAGAIIGEDCALGDNTTLKARVTLYDNVRLGKRTLIHSGAVIGSDGFGFANEAGQWVKMPHLGGVVIGDQVEIGANTTIDRGFLEDTTLADGVIIDNLVQIGHNVCIGAHTAIAGCVAIAGSARIGAYCLIGGGSSIAGHIEIADHVHITATSGVNHSLHERGVYSSGFPAKPAALWRKNAARFQYLDEMARRLRVLERRMSQ